MSFDSVLSRSRLSLFALVLSLAVVPACSDPTPPATDSGEHDGSTADTSVPDAFVPTDAFALPDAIATDANTPLDAASEEDAATEDAAIADDAGPVCAPPGIGAA